MFTADRVIIFDRKREIFITDRLNLDTRCLCKSLSCHISVITRVCLALSWLIAMDIRRVFINTLQMVIKIFVWIFSNLIFRIHIQNYNCSASQSRVFFFEGWVGDTWFFKRPYQGEGCKNRSIVGRLHMVYMCYENFC